MSAAAAAASTAATAATVAAGASGNVERGDMALLASRADHSLMRELTADPDAAAHAPNRTSRKVSSGHWVPVEPKPLPAPRLVAYSPTMAAELGLSDEAVRAPEFVRFFGGDRSAAPALHSWATPYALSIMGRRMYSNDPFPDGGYGDGRAISVGEVVVGGRRWEMQLKGGGPTPFCRGGDGRAVLRSSIREFLAQEAMHALGVPTTRSLSLVRSGDAAAAAAADGETVQRPWYTEIREDDPRLARYTPAQRREILSQPRDPDRMITEPCAITTRVAPSFMRVGHFDLFGRRAERDDATDGQRAQLAQLAEHVLRREYAHGDDAVADDGRPLADRVEAMLGAFAERIARLVAGWLRVGFCQGNFNADNCLLSGRQLDYGPFGFMDVYEPLFAKWVGSGEHYGFMNQPDAAFANFSTLASAVAPLLGDDAGGKVYAACGVARRALDAAVADTWRRKMGVADDDAGRSAAAALWGRLEPLLRRSRIDYTLFWRQLADVAELPTASATAAAAAATTTSAGGDGDGAPASLSVKQLKAELSERGVDASACVEKSELAALLDDARRRDAAGAPLLAPLADAFYSPPCAALERDWRAWLVDWRDTVTASAAQLRAVNPKYVPREWMLVDAYAAANAGDYSVLHELHALFAAPYDEQPALAAKYYRRAPDDALRKGGTAFMS